MVGEEKYNSHSGHLMQAWWVALYNSSTTDQSITTITSNQSIDQSINPSVDPLICHSIKLERQLSGAPSRGRRQKNFN